MESSSSSVKLTPKPVNLFYVWYTELCRRMNCTPAPVVKPAKPKCQTVLEFVGDRLKVDEWNPIVNALRSDTSLHVISIKSRIGNCEFLHDIDTEEKAKHMKRRFGSLWTAYVLNQLTKSLSVSLKNTDVLTYLELDGIPLFTQYLEPLLQALKKNKTVRHLSLANCAIKDGGCQMVCGYLRFAPNIEVVNLTGCDLTSISGEHLAKLIKYQQINRYCESWHNSLRYANPESSAMRGIKRITINLNPSFGDEGLDYILNELEDDLWLKALDLQRCGITENLGPKVVDIVQYNRSLEIMDLRQNEMLNITTVERVLQLLRDKQQFGYQPEFQWCNTALTLTLDSLHGGSSTSMGTSIHKTKSAPTKNLSRASTAVVDPVIRKSKTMDNFQKIMPKSVISDLNIKLYSEKQKRKLIEKQNEELKHKLEEIQNSKTQSSVTKKSLKVMVGGVDRKPKVVKERRPLSEGPRIPIHKEVKEVKDVKGVRNVQNGFKPALMKPLMNGSRNGFKLAHSAKNGLIKRETTVNGAGDSNCYKNGFSSKILNNACKMFENMMKKGTFVDNNTNDCEELLDYFINDKCINKDPDNLSQISSESHASLYEYMNELKNNDEKT